MLSVSTVLTVYISISTICVLYITAVAIKNKGQLFFTVPEDVLTIEDKLTIVVSSGLIALAWPLFIIAGALYVVIFLPVWHIALFVSKHI